MKLAAIYNTWDGLALLPGSMKSISSGVDFFIIVDQMISNWGEGRKRSLPHLDFNPVVIDYHPPRVANNYQTASDMETEKRNIGLRMARDMGCTHFLCLDCDEYYERGDIEKGKEILRESDLNGLVVPLYTYYSPTLRTKWTDDYYVPFIHEIKPSTRMSKNCQYPYRVDPTRKVLGNWDDRVALVNEIKMHHFSYIRPEPGGLERKVRNSTARQNINSENLLNEIRNLKHGDVFRGKKLIEVCTKGIRPSAETD